MSISVRIPSLSLFMARSLWISSWAYLSAISLPLCILPGLVSWLLYYLSSLTNPSSSVIFLSFCSPSLVFFWTSYLKSWISFLAFYSLVYNSLNLDDSYLAESKLSFCLYFSLEYYWFCFFTLFSFLSRTLCLWFSSLASALLARDGLLTA